ncbi:hypothetical protein ACMFMG_005975 [Clarireedia jacksonii]
MHEKEQNDRDPLEGKIPKPIRNAARAVRSAGSAPGRKILWEKAKPEQMEQITNTVPHIRGEIVDNWECFAK